MTEPNYWKDQRQFAAFNNWKDLLLPIWKYRRFWVYSRHSQVLCISVTNVRKENLYVKRVSKFSRISEIEKMLVKDISSCFQLLTRTSDNSLSLVEYDPTALGLLASFTSTGLAGIILQSPSKAIKSVKVVKPCAQAQYWKPKGSNASIFQYLRPFCF